MGLNLALGNSRPLSAWRRRGRKLVHMVRQDGLVETTLYVRRYVEYAREKRFGAPVDRKYGCETGGQIPLDRLAIRSPSVGDGVQYQAVSGLYFHRMLGAVRIPPDTHAFVDLGSGKGRALLMAAEYPFKRIVGVEFSPELHEIAQQNVERFRARSGSKQTFELHLGDAASYDFPPEPVALFLYNPFGERVLRRVIERLGSSLREVPREVLVFYKTPVHRHVLDDAPFLTPVKATSQYAVFAGDHLAAKSPAVLPSFEDERMEGAALPRLDPTR